MTSCGYDKELWRCGDSSFMGAETPEIPQQDDETGEYDITWRAPFPGAPFRDNEFDETDPENPFPIVVCTPSIMNESVLIRMASPGTYLVALFALIRVVLSYPLHY